jgi:hypothetical protein
MKTIDVFYQGEGVKDIEHIELGADETFAALKAKLSERHGLPAECLLFLEDEDEPVDERKRLADHAGKSGIKAHVHRCRRIVVSVRFNCKTVQRHFPPSATIARVKRWAAEKEFGMSAQEASEHMLQVSGSHERPAPGTHLGALVNCKKCCLAFDLVPDERVNG